MAEEQVLRHGMSLAVNSNIASLKAQRQLQNTSNSVSDSYAKLSSGLRINKPSDDAAGLAVAASLKADTRIFTQAISNLNEGVSLLILAEAAHNELSNITTRQIELAEQAANESFSLDQKRGLDSEANALVDEYNRIVSLTSYNGQQVLSSSIDSITIQAGTGTTNAINVALSESFERTTGDGTFQTRTTLSSAGGAFPYTLSLGDFNNDGTLDIVSAEQGANTAALFIGNGNGTFQARISFSGVGSDPTGIDVADFNGDGNLDFTVSDTGGSATYVFLGNGNGTFAGPISYAIGSNPFSVEIADVNSDGKLDIIGGNNTGSSVSVLLGNGDGTFNARTSFITGGNVNFVQAGDFNGDGKVDLLTAGTTAGSLTTLISNGDGTFKALQTWFFGGSNMRGGDIADFNHDGYQDFVVVGTNGLFNGVFLGNGDGSFKAGVSYWTSSQVYDVVAVDIDGDGILDIAETDTVGTVYTLIGNADGTFKASVSTNLSTGTIPAGIVAGDLNKDGANDLVVADYGTNTLSIFAGNTREVTTAPKLDLLTQSGARSAILTLSDQLSRITLELGSLGASQSRFEIAINTISSTRINYDTARCRIEDIDVAEETSKLVSQKILAKSAAAILAQANQQPKVVMKLLDPKL